MSFLGIFLQSQRQPFSYFYQHKDMKFLYFISKVFYIMYFCILFLLFNTMYLKSFIAIILWVVHLLYCWIVSHYINNIYHSSIYFLWAFGLFLEFIYYELRCHKCFVQSSLKTQIFITFEELHDSRDI